LITHQITPLHIAGNTTEKQNLQLKGSLDEAVNRVYKATLKQLDEHRMGLMLEFEDKLKAELTSAAHKIIERLTASAKYQEEETISLREYPPTYSVRPIDAQVIALREAFPQLGGCIERLTRNPVPEEAEAWFAIPRWQALAPTYSEAVEIMITVLESRRRFSNRLIGNLGPKFLRQNERTRLAEQMVAAQQPGSDILVLAAQFGLRHRGCSARRARVVMAGNEFGLGAFALGCMLITHPERLSMIDTLMIDCSGDEYSLRADTIYDRVPLFDYDLGGIGFSVFYEDRARNLWGTPTAFAVQISLEKTPLAISSAVPRHP
jgi:hypothetical protein